MISRVSLATAFACVLISAFVGTGVCDEVASTPVVLELGQKAVDIRVGAAHVATYVFNDPEIPRPYFAHVKSPGGLQVTRSHPPQPGRDRTDHATLHPGIWMAFGDLDGTDFWRNKSKIQHAGFEQAPRGGNGSGSFVEKKQYLRDDGSLICSETFRFEIRVKDGGYLFRWESNFRAEREFYFGDQEEMGLGMRVATPISELAGGVLSDSQGRKGAQAIWSHAAQWCDYSGVVHGQAVGLTLLVHPDNFRPSWMHARDYGFCAANPFGRQAMHQGPISKVVVRPDESLTLRYGIWIHAGAPSRAVLNRVYADYVQLQ